MEFRRIRWLGMRKPVERRRFVAVDFDLRDKRFEKSLFCCGVPPSIASRRAS